MGTPTLFTHVPQYLDAANAEIFVDGAVSEAVVWPALFRDMGAALTRSIQKSSLLPAGAYNAHTTGDDIPTSPLQDGVQVTYDHEEQSIGYEVAAGIYDFMSAADWAEFVRGLGGSSSRAVETFLLKVISTGFTANSHDGVPLYSNSHPRGDGSGALVDNLGTSGLDIDAVEATIISGLQMVSPEGLTSPVYFDTVLVAIANIMNAERIVADLLKNDTTNSYASHSTNVVARRIRQVIGTPEFSDGNDWQMFDSTTWAGEFFPTVRPNPKVFIDPKSGNLIVNDRIHMAGGHKNAWRATYGHQVA